MCVPNDDVSLTVELLRNFQFLYVTSWKNEWSVHILLHAAHFSSNHRAHHLFKRKDVNCRRLLLWLRIGHAETRGVGLLKGYSVVDV